MPNKSLSVIYNEDGELTQDFMDFADEFDDAIEHTLTQAVDWLKEQDCNPIDFLMLQLYVQEHVEYVLMSRYLTGMGDKKLAQARERDARKNDTSPT